MNTDQFFAVTSEQKHNQNYIRVLIVDDQKVIRTKIKEILSSSSDIEIVGMADDGDKAIALTKILEPNIVLMDIEMPKINGIEATKIISQKFPQTKVLVLSTHKKEEYIQKIITAGAEGYILKQTPAREFLAAIYAVNRGYSHFGPNILKKIKVVVEESDTSTSIQRNSSDEVKSTFKSFHDQSKVIERTATTELVHQSNSSQQIVQTPPENSNLQVVQLEEFLPPIEKWLTWGGLCVMVILITVLPLSSVLKYKTKVKSPATIRPQGEIRLVQAKIEGQIAEILLKPGAAVAKGDVIATIDSSRLMTRKSQLKKAIAQQELQLTQLGSQVASIDNQIIAERERNNSEIRGAKSRLLARIRSYQEKKVEVISQVEEAQANLRAAEASLQASKQRIIRFQAAATAGAISKEQLAETELEAERQKQEIVANQARLRTAQAELNPGDAEVDVARQDIEQAKKSGQGIIANLARQKEATIQQRITINQQLEQDTEELRQTELDLGRTIIKATESGEISQLELRNPGQTVAIGQEIARIVPDNAELEIRLLTSPQDISKLELDQQVQMRVSACPYPDYGVLEGTLSRLPRDINQPNSRNSQNASQPQTRFYEIIVKPEARSFGSKENQCSLQIGMEGTAEIITREESVLNFILRKARLISNV